MRRFGIALVFVLVLGILAAGCIKPADTPAPTTPAPTTTKPPTVAPTTTPPPKPVVYEGTIYVAGMGGHFAKADVKIDPSKTDAPIAVNKLSRINLHSDPNTSKKVYATHDPRIDGNTLYWSTNVNDTGSNHVGKVDLTTGTVAADEKIAIAPDVTKAPIGYCGSGQTKNEYMPVMMGYKGYVDVIEKATMKLKHRVSLVNPDIPASYFAHGTNTPDMKNFLLTMGEAAVGGVRANGTGKQLFYLLDMDSLVKGELKIVKKSEVIGTPAKTIGFRQSYTKDGKYLLQSASERFYLIDAAALTAVDAEMMPTGWDNHDAIGTPDSKYAVLAIRVSGVERAGKKFIDGQIVLYDISKKEIVGKPVSTCDTCHADMGNAPLDVLLCGADAVWK